MRATGQTHALTGALAETERRLVAARAILGEWLGGSGGGWQDSGGVWPGIKLIEGVAAAEGDSEFGISRDVCCRAIGFSAPTKSPPKRADSCKRAWCWCMAAWRRTSGPILEMVTEKYLLRSEAEWQGRQQAIRILDEILGHLERGRRGGHRRGHRAQLLGPIQTIIPWATNLYTETLIRRAREELGAGFWGFWMLGGMSGGGMGFIFDPAVKAHAQERLAAIMSETKRRLERAVPFAMEPVVYDFAINERGTHADLLTGDCRPDAARLLHAGRAGLLRIETRLLPAARRAELDRFAAACRTAPELSGMVQNLFDHMLPRAAARGRRPAQTLERCSTGTGSTACSTSRSRPICAAAASAWRRTGCPSPAASKTSRPAMSSMPPRGLPARIANPACRRWPTGMVAVVTLAGGAGSRWTKGAGVVKALHPFCKLAGRHRNFIEAHLAKSRRTSRICGTPVPHVITTSYLTHEPIGRLAGGCEQLRLSRTAAALAGTQHRPAHGPHGARPALRLGGDAAAAARRTDPESARKPARRLIGWAQQAGEGANYTDNLPMQCLHPVGHWYELPNLLAQRRACAPARGAPAAALSDVHNIDTLGAISPRNCWACISSPARR